MSSPILIQELLLIKQLYQHGVIHSQHPSDFSKYLSVLHFDNSVEACLKIIARKYAVLSSARQEFKFKDLWEEIDKKITPQSLPLKTEMQGQHDLRNLAQHSGTIPSDSDIKKYDVFTKDFLEKAFILFLGYDFNKIYGSSLIKNTDLQLLLKLAEDNLDNNKWEESIIESAKAMAKLELVLVEELRTIPFWTIASQPPQIKINHIGFSLHGTVEREIMDKLKENNEKIFTETNKAFNEIHKSLKEVTIKFDSQLAILKLGVNYFEYNKFKKLGPIIIHSIGSSEPTIAKRSEKVYTAEDAYFSYDFVLNLTIQHNK